jgi:glycosyltransferase involved in cell wall biosynthesis
MKVLMVTELYPPNCGGGGWSTYNLAKALHDTEEVEVKVLAVNQEEVKEDVPVEKVSVRRFPNELAYHQIKNEIEERKEEYDVIQGQHSLTIPPLGLIDKPTIGVIRDYWPICYQTTLRDNWGNNHLRCGVRCIGSTVQDFHVLSPYKFFNHSLRKRLTGKVDRLVPISSFVDARLEDLRAEKTVIPDVVLDESKEVSEARGEDDIIYFGKFIEQKDPEIMVELAEKYREIDPDQNFALMGKETELTEKIRKEIDDRGLENIEVPGHVEREELLKRLKGARAVVSPSQWYEPLSMSRIEALEFGKPLFALNIGSAPEIIEDGQNGFLYTDTDGLVEKIRELEDEETLEKISQKARKTYEERYSPEKVASQYIEVYREMIA